MMPPPMAPGQQAPAAYPPPAGYGTAPQPGADGGKVEAPSIEKDWKITGKLPLVRSLHFTS
jgi:hypothetical protein